MWDLNKDNFKEIPYIEDYVLFSRVTPYQVFLHYIGEFELHRPICSPLRQDEVPSFVIIKSKEASAGLLYHDFATGETGNAVRFVANLYCIGYRQALYKIACDFQIVEDIYNISAKVAKRVLDKIALTKPITKKVKIGITKRQWKLHDKTFWKQFGIRKSTLERFNVCPIQYLFLNDRIIKVDKHAYAYQEEKDGMLTFKIYQPYSKTFKWINNTNSTVHQGYVELPESGDIMIITKALKDVMSMLDVCDIPSIGLQAESVKVKESVIDEYRNRFKKVICLFDNDNAGIKLGEKFASSYGLPLIRLPEHIGKDFSDSVKNVGKNKARQVLQELIKQT